MYCSCMLNLLHVYTCTFCVSPPPPVLTPCELFSSSNVTPELEEGGSDHVILPDPVLLPVESISSSSGGITC